MYFNVGYTQPKTMIKFSEKINWKHIVLGVVKRNPLFLHEIEWKNNGFLFTTPNIKFFHNMKLYFRATLSIVYKIIKFILNILFYCIFSRLPIHNMNRDSLQQDPLHGEYLKSIFPKTKPYINKNYISDFSQLWWKMYITLICLIVFY